MLSTQNLQLKIHPSKKLKPRWVGPYKILEQLNTSYRLQLPPELHIHPVFHASLLRLYRGPPPRRPPALLVDSTEEYEVERIIHHRLVRGQPQYLIRWRSYGPESDTY